MQKTSVGIYLSSLVVIIIVLASSYGLMVRDADHMEHDLEIPFEKDSMVLYQEPEEDIEAVHFSISDDLGIPSEVDGSYPVYGISFADYTNETANKTIDAVFGNVTEMTTIFRWHDGVGFDYTVPGGMYGIMSSGYYNIRIFYMNHTPTSPYSEEEISTNASLYNSTQCKSISDNYIRECLDDEFSLFTHKKSSKSIEISHSGTFTVHYTFRYTRFLENITVHDDMAGMIFTWVSPDGTFLSFNMYLPALEKIGSTSPIDPIEAVHKMDSNYDEYRKYLVSGMSPHTLSKIELAYGRVDDKITIGWQLSFYLDGDTSIISEVFVS